MSQSLTDFLTSTTTYLTGAASAFNLAGNFYDFNISDTVEEADSRAIRNDFRMIEGDVAEGFKIFRGKSPEQLELSLS